MKIVSVLVGVTGGLLMLLGIFNLLDGRVPTSLDGFQAWSLSSLVLGAALTISGAILILAAAVLAVARRAVPYAAAPPYAGMPPQA